MNDYDKLNTTCNRLWNENS